MLGQQGDRLVGGNCSEPQGLTTRLHGRYHSPAGCRWKKFRQSLYFQNAQTENAMKMRRQEAAIWAPSVPYHGLGASKLSSVIVFDCCDGGSCWVVVEVVLCLRG